MSKLWILPILAIAGGGAWWWLHGSESEAPKYMTAPVTQGPITQAVTATGTLNPVINVTVGSQISGNIQKLHADFNSPVKAGQVVAELDPATFQAVVHQAEGDVALAESTLELAKLTARRKEELVGQRIEPQADLDAAKAALLQAQATLKIKRANLEKAQVDLERCTIRSPVDGTVISRKVDVGQTVAATMNAPELFIIANDLTKMQIDTNVAEADVGNVAEKQPVEFTVDAFPFRTFKGEVAQVRNAATTVQNVVTYNVVVSVDNSELKLKPGMTANVSIIIAQRENAMVVPNSALRFRLPEAASSAGQKPSGGGAPGGAGGPPKRMGGGSGGKQGPRKLYVMAPGASKPEPVEVKLGITDGVNTEVLEGVKPGDLVATGVVSPVKSAAPASQNPLTGGMGRPR